MTIYENQKHGWTQKLIAIGSKGIKKKPSPPIPQYNSISCDKKQKDTEKQKMLLENGYLKFDLNHDLWYQGTKFKSSSISASDSSAAKTELSEIWKESRTESWIWLETGDEGSIILSEFEFFEFPNNMWKLYRTNGCKQTYFSGRELLDHNTANFMWLQYDKIKKLDKKGAWTKTEEFCKLGNKRSIDTKQQKNLKLFCAKPRS